MTGLSFERHTDGVIDVVVDRAPDNLMTVEMCAEFADYVAHPPPDIHILRLRARGEVFCLGRERTGAEPAELVAETQTLSDLHWAIRSSSLVSIAEVSGDAAGFGVGLVAACDVAVSIADAHFHFPEVGINLAPALVLAWLPRIVGEREAFWLTASGERITGRRAQQLGLVNDVVNNRDELAKTVADRVSILRAHNPRVHAEIKSMLRAFASLDEERALEHSIHRLVVGALRRKDAPAPSRSDQTDT